MTGSFQNDMTNIKSKDDVLTLMVHLGYLAYDSKEKAVLFQMRKCGKNLFLR